MTAKELIEQLSKVDPNTVITLQNNEHGDYYPAFGIEIKEDRLWDFEPVQTILVIT